MGQVKLKVSLLKYTPNPEETIALAAKVCYSASNVEDLNKKITVKDQSDFIKKLVEIGHLSPIEHASFTFAIEGISRACSHQLVRHRLASYSQQSQRYVSSGRGFSYIVPESISKDHTALQVYKEFMEKAQSAYSSLVEKLNEQGLVGEEAYQDARFVLPNACETRLMMTMNARELLHFFHQRCCNRAQWEIHSLADEILRLVRGVAPTIFNAAGPGCVVGHCGEGDLTCGEIDAVRRKYEILQ